MTSVKEGVEILDVFYQYTPRQRIRQVYEGKIERVYRKFNEQLQQVRRNLSFNKPVGLLDQPMYAGKNIWLNNLQIKINSTVNILQSASWFSEYGIMKVSKGEYRDVVNIVKSQIEQVNKKWIKTSDKNASKKLESTVLTSNLHFQGCIDVNFDRGLLKTIKEVSIWITYDYAIPSYIKAVYNKIATTMILYKHITKLVQDYNQIMTSISSEEKGLFRDKIRKLDRFIWMGRNQHTWSTADLKDWVKSCADVSKVALDDITNYKKINTNVQSLCHQIEALEMINLKNTDIVSGERFKSHQMKYIKKIQSLIAGKYEQIQSSLGKLRLSFTRTQTMVEVQWKKYQNKIDEKVAKAIRNGILTSLIGLAEAISSSSKTGVTPMMRVTVTLKDSQVVITPRLSTITDIFKE